MSKKDASQAGASAPKSAPKPRRGNPENLKPAWKPGQSGNPKGRAKGSRNALGEAFIEAMHADFKEHGEKVIETVRTEKPDQYLKVVASILPKELNVNTNAMSELSDAELDALAALVEWARAGVAEPASQAGEGGTEAKTRH